MSSMMHTLHLTIVGLYALTLAILTVYGVHRYVQVFLYYRHMRKRPAPAGHFAKLPKVTIQLPMYNERYVAARIIEASCKMDYPAELLQIQVLDDSTDESAEIARECCERMRKLGHNVDYVHRTNRTGYKAGALESGMQSATGEFIVIFDADFVPSPEMLRAGIDYFTDSNIGCVQTRWGHLNREHSLLTRCQAIFLDGHFMIEHTARNCSGRFINFNGTAGIWRRKAIEESGGWQHDTLTEDMDLSYRAQLRGWRFVFLPFTISPAELPPEITSFKQQQHRWTKGSVQTAVKLLPTIMRSPLPWWVKLEAFFHLSSGLVYMPAVILSLLLFPAWAMDTNLLNTDSILVGIIVMSFFGLLTCSAGTFYMVSQQAIGRSGWKTFFMIPMLMAIGMGISIINMVAVIEGLFGRKDSEFVRTPKYGTGGDRKHARDWRKRAGAFRTRLDVLPFVEIACGIYMGLCLTASIMTRIQPGSIKFIKDSAPGTVPFLVIFMFGYLYVGIATLHNKWLSAHAKAPAPEESLEVAEPVTV